ncbi:hypothetical protein BDN72DRAFT_891831 [Pluteus cervinus]|uniref:Uncharacterized protein n=1 Tax=Pluteus cervinus TaxID=181527 RepID=A0ACD3BDH0_9AGAR|nr:hypothetical protein BDN72DRAFT_891831 [Pluteus cervinus]
MATQTHYTQAYRGVLRELRKSTSVTRKVNSTVSANIRAIFSKHQTTNDPSILRDIESATLFLKSQREHKALLERYNPLFDLTSQERIAATARRVGLNMPKSPSSDE